VGLGVVLDRQDIQFVAFYSFHSAVVGVDLEGLKASAFLRARNYCKVMILGGDVDDLFFQVFHGLVASVVAELELESICSKREGDDLVAEADSKDWDLACEVLHCSHGRHSPLWIPRPIGDEQGLWACSLDIGDAGVRRKNMNVEPAS